MPQREGKEAGCQGEGAEDAPKRDHRLGGRGSPQAGQPPAARGAMAGLPPQIQVKVPVDKSKEDHGSDRGDENCDGKPRSHLRENPPKAQESAKEDKCGYSSGNASTTVIRQDHPPQRHGDVEGLPGEGGREEERKGEGGEDGQVTCLGNLCRDGGVTHRIAEQQCTCSERQI